MSTITIKRTMYSGKDIDSGEPEFVLKTEHPDGAVLQPWAGELSSVTSTPEAFNRYMLLGASLGNAVPTVPFESWAERLNGGHTVIWQDEISVELPDELE